MIDNCFTFVYERMANLGYNVPAKWRDYDYSDKNVFIKNQDKFLSNNEHIEFFKSFCSIVDEAQKGDIVLSRISVGIALNTHKQWVYSETTKKAVIRAIRHSHTIMRVDNG